MFEDKVTEHNVKILLDDITFMAFDLERGGFIEMSSVTDIGEDFVLTYTRTLISDDVIDGWMQIISDFNISATKNGNEFIRFDVRGAMQKFTLYNLEGFVAGMFLNKLDSFRKMKFGINS